MQRGPIHVAPADAPTEEVAVWVDGAFTFEERRTIRLALEDWNAALNGYMRFYVRSEKHLHPSTDGAVSVEKVWDDDTVTVDQEYDGADGTMAWVSGVAAHDMHVISWRVPDGELRPIIKHEMGHVLGLKHSEYDNTLMSTPYNTVRKCIDPETIRRVAQRHGWDVHHMNPECGE